MSITFIVICVFILLAILMSIFWRKGTLNQLALWTNERILFEEQPMRVEAVYPNRNTLFINCVIRLTHFRIIIAQKPLFANQPQLRYVIHLKEASGFPVQSHPAISNVFQTGYLTFPVSFSAVTVHTESDKPFVSLIPETADALLSPKELKLSMTRWSEFMTALNQMR